MYSTINEIEEEKVEEIAKSMKENGWQGAPCLVYGDVLITGCHRQEAADRAGIQFECIDITDLESWDKQEFEDWIMKGHTNHEAAYYTLEEDEDYDIQF